MIRRRHTVIGQTGSHRRIAIIDDHNLVLNGLQQTLAAMNDDYEIIGASSPTDILDRLTKSEPFDLILCDLIMDGMNGLAFLGALKSRRDRTPVLLMSGIAMDPPIQQMQALGAAGFVHKSIEPAALQTVIQKVLNGETYFPGADSAPPDSMESAFDHDEIVAINNLTDRQKEVLKALAKGATNQQISDQLSISPNTVKTHIKHIYDAMGVSRRTACVQKAQLYGII